jgi:hypothetical protein
VPACVNTCRRRRRRRRKYYMYNIRISIVMTSAAALCRRYHGRANGGIQMPAKTVRLATGIPASWLARSFVHTMAQWTSRTSTHGSITTNMHVSRHRDMAVDVMPANQHGCHRESNAHHVTICLAFRHRCSDSAYSECAVCQPFPIIYPVGYGWVLVVK